MARIYLGNVKGPKGDTGATGATGPQGEAATIEVGSVSTTAYGNAAQVTNVGSSSAAKFNFVIPQGKPGEKTTKMGELTLDTITTSTEEFPSPAVGDTGATVFGKIVKFFSDVLASLTNKIDVSKIANDFTTTDASYVAAAPTVKALNDSLNNAKGFVPTGSGISGYTASRCRYTKIGNVLFIAFSVVMASSATNGAQVMKYSDFGLTGIILDDIQFAICDASPSIAKLVFRLNDANGGIVLEQLYGSYPAGGAVKGTVFIITKQ